MSSYDVMLAHFEGMWSAEDPDPRKAHAGVILVYSWMGRASAKLSHLNNYDEALPALRTASAGERLSIDQLLTIREYVSGSMIGASKYLHFLRPDVYPIWDQWVAQAVAGKSTRGFLQSPSNYRAYVDQIGNFQLPKRLDAEVVAAIGDVSEVRKIEFSIFNLMTNASEAERHEVNVAENVR